MKTREDWLLSAVDLFRPYFLARKLEIQPVRVACGFPSKSALSKNRRLGECWSSESTNDGSRQVFVTPLIEKPVEVLGVLSHELAHASLPDDAKHGPKFKDAMKQLGLEGRASSALPGPDLLAFIETMAETLGEYPNVALNPKDSKERAAQAKKSFKLFCPDKRDCTNKCLILDHAVGEDYTTTTGKKALKLGFPHCPCGSEMEMETEDFELYKLAIAE